MWKACKITGKCESNKNYPLTNKKTKSSFILHLKKRRSGSYYIMFNRKYIKFVTQNLRRLLILSVLAF